MNNSQTPLPIEHHKVPVLHFSGGKDSIACLHLLKPWWNKLTVMWLNTGAAFPETLAQMEEVKQLVRFVEVKSDQPGNLEANGPPADVVPWESTPLGRYVAQTNGARVQSALDCCSANIWQPFAKATKESGATLVIRGQRRAEALKSPLANGSIVEGVEYWYPIESMTDQQVSMYLAANSIALPANYEYFNSSLDCWSCTAYLKHRVGISEYMQKRHPELHRKRQIYLRQVYDAIKPEVAQVEAALA